MIMIWQLQPMIVNSPADSKQKQKIQRKGGGAVFYLEWANLEQVHETGPVLLTDYE